MNVCQLWSKSFNATDKPTHHMTICTTSHRDMHLRSCTHCQSYRTTSISEHVNATYIQVRWKSENTSTSHLAVTLLRVHKHRPDSRRSERAVKTNEELLIDKLTTILIAAVTVIICSTAV